MATGVPRTHRKGQEAEPALPSTSSGISLAYEGKRPAWEILLTEAASTRVLWQEPTKTGLVYPQTLNALYYGDNKAVLAMLLQNEDVCGKVRLVYIDPPFATNSVFQSRTQGDAYCDLLGGAHYLEFLRERLILLRELLSNDGSLYVHLDENMAFPVKMLMDEIFGRKNFRNWITRKKCNPKNYTHKTYGNISDYILFYTKSDTYIWNRPFAAWTATSSAKEYPYVEEGTGRRYKKVPLHAPGVRNGSTGQIWRGRLPPPGKHWQYTPATLDEMDARGEIYWSSHDNPRRKIYLEASEGIPVQDIWMDLRDAHNQNIAITGYPTEKNPDLLARVIEASSNPGDLVLDCFAGSGTTLAVASQHRRRWIGIDNSVEAIATILRRFARGREPMGDFVQKQHATPSQDAPRHKSPAWEPGEISRERVALKEEKAIYDFVLSSVAECEEDLTPILAQWLAWIEEDCSLQ